MKSILRYFRFQSPIHEDRLFRLSDHELIETVSNPQKDSSERSRAALLLGDRRCQDATPVLVRLVETRTLFPQADKAVIAASIFALGSIGDQKSGALIVEAVRNDSSLSHSAVVALGLLGYEPAIPVLIEIVQSDGEPWLRALTAGVLKNSFGRNEGLEAIWPQLLSADENEHRAAAKVYLGVKQEYRDAVFTDKVIEAMKVQTNPNRLVGLMGALIGADDPRYRVARFLYNFLNDERKAREPFLRKRKAMVGDFAAYYLVHLLRGHPLMAGIPSGDLASSLEERRKFREAVKREAAKIVFRR